MIRLGFLLLLIGTTCRGQDSFPSAGDTVLLSVQTEVYKLDGEGDAERHLFSEVRLRYPVFPESTPAGATASKTIRAHLARLLGAEGVEERFDLDEAARGFLRAYSAHRKASPDAKGIWFAHLKTQVLHESGRLLTLLLEDESYSGASPPATRRAYYTFDRRTGEVLRLNELFTDLNAVHRLADQWFRTARSIPDTVDLRALGFRFPHRTFALPNNVGLTAKSATFYHQPGDVSPAADGGITVILPMRDLRPYLKVQP